MQESALILIDIQNDFMPGGALAVPYANEIVPLANRLQDHFDLVIASQDWHPEDHGSFAVNHAGRQPGEIIDLHGVSQILWPKHCVQETKGAAFVDTLEQSHIQKIIYKGTHADVDSYSIFFDNARRQATALDAYLKQKKIKNIYLLGVATDYCVYFSALDGCSLGYHVFLIEDACRGIDANTGDVAKALQVMREQGVRLIQSRDIIRSSQ